MRLDPQIAAPILVIAAYDLHDKIGTIPELLTNAAGIFLQHEGQVRFSKLAPP